MQRQTDSPSIFICVLVLVCVIAGSSSAPLQAQSSSRETPIVRAIKATRPSVVNINGRKTVRDEDAPAGATRFRQVNGMGTGVVIDERGYIVTNFHVVQGVAKIRVTLPDSKQYVARLVGHDPRTDLAVIKINPSHSLPTIPYGTSSDLMLGETVIAIGNAYGYKNTITRGIISELDRTVEVPDDQTYYNLIQTDAAINPGNSGGPLINVDGEMIGINVAVRMGAQSIGFAIPVNPAMEIAADLIRKDNKSGHMLAIDATTDFKFNYPRLIVKDSKSLSEVYPGDQIVSINDREVRNRLDLERMLIGRQTGDALKLELKRGSVTLNVESKVVLANSSKDTRLSSRLWQVLGLKLSEIPASQFRQISDEFRGGLRVQDVRRGSQASSQRIQAGDVLLGIHEWETTKLGHIAYIIEQNTVLSGQPIEFYVLRNGEVLKGNFQIAMRNN